MRQELRMILSIGAVAVIALAGCTAKNINDAESAQDGTAEMTKLTESTSVSTTESTEENVPAETALDTAADTDPEPAEPSKIPLTGNTGDLNYQILPSSVEGLKERGYYVFEERESEYPCKIIIAAGEFSTGGHDIAIVDVRYDGSEVTVVVKETSPAPTDIVTEAFTYPSCGIELSTLPGMVKVTDPNGNEFNCLYFYLLEEDIEPDWIAVIKNGGGEIMHETYVYETVNGKYSYINVLSMTVSYGSTHWKEVVKGSGFADSREDVVEAAKKFGSYGFVIFPDDMQTPHTIEEFLG